MGANTDRTSEYLNYRSTLFSRVLDGIISPSSFKVLKANGKERRYSIYNIEYLSNLPENAVIGDLAILSTCGRVSGYFYNSNEVWEPDTGCRAMQGSRLVHFPDKEWKRFILHGEPEYLHWEFEDKARLKIKKSTLSNNESTTRSNSVMRLKHHSSHSTKARTPSPLATTESTATEFHQNTFSPTTYDPSASLITKNSITVHRFSSSQSPPLPISNTTSSESNTGATKLICNTIAHFKEIFSDSLDIFEKCAGPLIRLLNKGNSDSIPIVPPGNAKKDGLLLDCHISMASLFEDLIKNKDEDLLKIEDSFRVSGNKTASDLIAAMCTHSKGVHGSQFPVILGAHNVPPHPKGTKGVEILLPYHLRNSAVCSPISNGFQDNTSVLTSDGYITDPHWDFFGIPQLVLHSGGTKLWLIWLPTPENLRKAADTFFSIEKAIDFTIANALEELNNLEIRICTQQDEWFILPPCAVHAVITVEASGHKNKLFVDYGYFDTWDQAYSLIVEALVSAHKQEKDSSKKDAIIEEILVSRKAFHHWESLLKQKNDHPSASMTQARLSEIKEETKFQLKSLGYGTDSSRKRSSPSEGVHTRKRVKRLRK
jgi:hypothetical protein